MKFLIIFVIFASASCSEKTINQICTHSHEKYQACSNGCQTTCENYLNPPICIAACLPDRAGCYFEPPYVRHQNGNCVPTSQCNPKIVEPQQPHCTCSGRNEVYNPKSTVCPRTCATKDLMFKCTADTQPGCFCAPGYLRNCNNKCVLESDCS